MYLGKIVELGAARRALPRAAASLHAGAALGGGRPRPGRAARAAAHVVLEGDIPSPLDPPSGCRFRTRCPLEPRSAPQSTDEEPRLVEFARTTSSPAISSRRTARRRGSSTLLLRIVDEPADEQHRIEPVTVAPAEVELPPAFHAGSRRRMRLLAPLVTNRTARLGVALLALLLGVAIVGPLVAPGNGSIVAMLSARNSAPSWSHPFGTTIQGLDVLSQVLNAAPLTLELVAGATAIALLIAVALGVAAGAFGGRVDAFVSGITGVCLAIPMLPLAIVVAGIVPKQQHTALATMLMIGLGSWPAEARVLRAQALALRSTDFVASATAVGESRVRILFFEFVPNMASRVAAGAFFVAIQAMVALATLDFLASLSRGRFALGDTNGATWGSVLALAQTQEALLTGSWWAFAFPALALLTLAAGLVLTMYGIEEIADPRLRRAGRTRRLGVRVPAVRLPRLPQIELRSPLPALRSTVAAAPHVGRHLLRRGPIYAVALWVAVTIAYALPASPHAAGCRRRRRAVRSGAAMPTSSAKSRPATSASACRESAASCRIRCPSPSRSSGRRPCSGSRSAGSSASSPPGAAAVSPTEWEPP